MSKVLFNRTLAKMASGGVSYRGSMGKTTDRWSLGAVKLSTASRSNYAHEESVEGDWRFNAKLLKAAPEGAVVFNDYCSSWAGQDTVQYTISWTKGVDGAWHLNYG